MGATASRNEKTRHSSGDDNGPTMGGNYRADFDMYPEASPRFVSDYYKSLDNSDHGSHMRSHHASGGSGGSKKTIPTYLKWHGGGKDVYVSGSFNSWKENIPMVKSQDNFYTIVHLSEGSYQYKFFVDGQWQCDPNEPKDIGPETTNNVLEVMSTDFEVFDALRRDSLAAEEKVSSRSSNDSPAGVSGSPPGEYSQEIPVRSTSPRHHAAPPVLPPHLLQVILNKETPLHCEPTLLPEPNHVMLNHLYALSIKEGVMVLSAAHRYRKKYVTTLLYTPISG